KGAWCRTRLPTARPSSASAGSRSASSRARFRPAIPSGTARRSACFALLSSQLISGLPEDQRYKGWPGEPGLGREPVPSATFMGPGSARKSLHHSCLPAGRQAGAGEGESMSRIDESRPFVPIKIAVLTVSDTRTLADDTYGDTLVER